MQLETLVQREAIRQLRIDYGTAFDTMDEAMVRDIMMSDIICEYPESYGGRYTDLESVIALFKQIWAQCEAPLDTVHLVANHHVELLDSHHARGHCILLDLVNRQKEGSPISTPGGHANPLLLIGRYDDEYVKVGDKWKFARIKLTTLWPQRAG